MLAIWLSSVFHFACNRKLNYSAELAYGLKNSIMGDAYKKEEIKKIECEMEKIIKEWHLD